MDYRHRIKRLKLFLLVLFIALGAGLFWRMILQQHALSAKGFVDRKRGEMIHSLADQGIISPADAGVNIDETALKQSVSSAAFRQYILDRKPYMSFEDGAFRLDPAAISVSNRRWMKNKVELNRGRIYDRNMQVLAETRKDAKGAVKRFYPLGPAAFPLLGVAHPVYGKKGLEQYLDPYLKGTAEHGMLEQIYRLLAGREKTCDVVLTIDARLQQTAYESLAKRTGAVVVLDVATGEILAAASSPSFDPGVDPGPQWDAAEEKGADGPFVNRALGRRYPPGSTFKLVAASALMESPGFDPTWGIACRGIHPKYRIREHEMKRHGWMSLKNAVAMSCNVFFGEAGVRLGPSLLSHARLYGFNQKTDLAPQRSGPSPIVESRAFTGLQQINNGKEWRAVDFRRNAKLAAQSAIGQNSVEATPFQVAKIGACIGNLGVMMKPMLLKQIQFSKIDGHGRQPLHAQSFDIETDQRVMSKKTARAILEMMEQVTEKGTGYGIQKLFFENGQYRTGWQVPAGRANLFAGKTGTAQTGKKTADHSWFLAVAPVKNPRYSVAVIVENGGYGANAAGPVALAVMQQALNLN